MALLGASCAQQSDPSPPTTAASSVADLQPDAPTTTKLTPSTTQAVARDAQADNTATTTTRVPTTTQAPASTAAPDDSTDTATTETPPATSEDTETESYDPAAEYGALIDAFLGAGAVRDPCPISPQASQSITDGDYSEDWYAWEHCLLLGYGSDNHSRPEQHQVSEGRAREIVAEVWSDYGTWMAQAFFASAAASSPIREWGAPVVAVGDWTPGIPSLHLDPVQVEEICAGEGFEHTASCLYYGPVGSISGAWSAEKSAYEATLTLTEPNQIFMRAPNAYLLLHELAHAVDSNRWRLFGGDEPTGAAAIENERASGHGLSFRCLALDLYRRYTDAVDDTAHEVLNGLCRLHAPGYPTILEPEK